MRQVTIEAAEADLPGLVEAACRGEDIVIARDGRPLVRLIPVIRRPFRIGCSRTWSAPIQIGSLRWMAMRSMPV